MRRGQLGVNVLELTMTLALLGALGSFTVPALDGYTERARINRAIGEISRISIEINRWKINADSDSFPESLEAAGISVGTDPWGNAYTYVRIDCCDADQQRKDANLHQLNTDFDLFSNGPDGLSENQLNNVNAHDDIVRADNGAFVGKAENY